MAKSINNSDREELSRVFVECKKNRPQIPTDFGASLRSSGGTDGEHSLVELDLSGLAWKVGFRNNDVIEAVDAADFEMKGVSHRSLIEYLREDGQTCNMLIRRDREEVPSNYCWIAFRVKERRKKGGKPVVAKRVKRSVGTDIDQAERVHKELPDWALRTTSSTQKFAYDKTVKIRLMTGQNKKDRYLGFYRGSDVCLPMFTTDDFVLKMHSYLSVNGSIKGTVVAFSAKPQRSRKTNDDDDDDEGRDAIVDKDESCVSGDSCGTLQLKNFPSWMTGGEGIIGNSRMFIWTLNNDQTGLLSSLNEDNLYVYNSQGIATLGTKKHELDIREDESGEQVAGKSLTSTSIYPSIHDVDAS